MKENGHRQPIRISYPEMDGLEKLLQIKALIFLVCGEVQALDAVEKMADQYRERIPGLRVIFSLKRGPKMPLLENVDSMESLTTLEKIRLMALDEPFALAVVKYEKCLRDYTGDEGEKEFTQTIAMHTEFPGICLGRIDNLIWLSFYHIEEGEKIRFLGRDF